MNPKSLEEIINRIRLMELPVNINMVVAVARGGIIPATLIMQKLQCDLELLWINYRDNQNKPNYESPKLMKPISFDVKNKNILLVEDRIKTGASVNYAKQTLLEMGASSVLTFAVNGKADYCIYDEACFPMPWKV